MAKIYWIATHDYSRQHKDELSLKRCDIIELLSTDSAISGDEGWWTGKCNGKVGIFPSNYVTTITTSTDDDSLATEELMSAQDRAFPPIVSSTKIVLRSLIGSGGFGRVYRATYLDHDVAVKILGCSAQPDGLLRTSDVLSKDGCKSSLSPSYAAMLSQLFREGFMFHQLRHENITRLVGVCIDMPVFGLIMELAEGGSLASVIHSSLRIRHDIILNWVRQLASALQYLHHKAFKSAVLHRDLKSSNVLIMENLSTILKEGRQGPELDAHLVGTTLKITDFGLAKRTRGSSQADASTSATNAMAGTYAWMAPEVIRASVFSTASDVWSFGVLIWELLTGEIPYKNFENLTVAYGVAMNKMSLHVPASCPALWSDLLADCWKLDLDTRPTFNEIVERLAKFEVGAESVGEVEFNDLKDSWRLEIQNVMCDINEQQKQLKSQEVELGNQREAQLMYCNELTKREAKLEIRERGLAQREVDFLSEYQRKQELLASFAATRLELSDHNQKSLTNDERENDSQQSELGSPDSAISASDFDELSAGFIVADSSADIKSSNLLLAKEFGKRNESDKSANLGGGQKNLPSCACNAPTGDVCLACHFVQFDLKI